MPRRAHLAVDSNGSFPRTLSSRPVAQQETYNYPTEGDPVIRTSRLLQGLSGPQVDEVLRSAAYRKYPADTVITQQNTSADRLSLLVKGSARHFFLTPDGRKPYLLWLKPGDAFGTATLLAEPAEFLVSTEMISESWVLTWQRQTIRALAARYPRLLDNGLSIACDYLVWYLATHLSLICDTARTRLANVLVSLAHGIGRQRGDCISLDITNEQLANTAHLTHFTVSRLLNEWQRDGVLSKSRGKLLLFDPEKLFRKSQRTRTRRLLQQPLKLCDSAERDTKFRASQNH